MDLIVELTKRRGMSTILIHHDLGLAAAYCDRVVVMERAAWSRTARSADIFASPEHPYTRKPDARDAPARRLLGAISCRRRRPPRSLKPRPVHPPSWPGLTRPSIYLRKSLPQERWTPGSSPG